MAKQSLIWTALPNGYTEDGKSLRLSILLSPRLDPETDPSVLASFPDFVDWPATLAQAEIRIFYGSGSVALTGSQFGGDNRIDDTAGSADSALWQALFPGTTYVRGFAFKDLSKDRILSYDATAMHDLLGNLYRRLARISDEQLPTVSTLLDEPGWNQLINAVRNNDRRFMAKTGMRDVAQQFDGFREGFADIPDLEQNLARVQLFHTPLATPEVQQYQTDTSDPKSKARWRTYKRGQFPDKATLVKEIDFHQMVAAMNQYRTLLRKLGLVVDVLIAADAFAPSNNAPLQVKLNLPGAAGNFIRTLDANPVTRTMLSAKAFAALPRPAPQLGDFQVENGLLNLDPKKFRLLQTDVDGGSLKLMNFARTLDRQRLPYDRLDPVTRYEREYGAPALRTAGLVLVHRNRGAMLHNVLQQAGKKNTSLEKIHQSAPSSTPPAPPELYAEDLVRGFRVDMWDRTTAVWRSLCQRSEHYQFEDLAQPINVESDEGIVRLAATKSADDTSNQDVVNLHEAVVAWTGWSLCVPPPGKAIDKNDEVANTEVEVPSGVRMRSRFQTLKHSLPRLRFGREYWLRARAVDLAGNSLAPQVKDFGGEDPVNNATAFLRYEPVAGPAIALVRRKVDGEVIAPQEGESMERMAIRSFNDTPADNKQLTDQVSERFAVPVQSSAKDAELHGMLDKAGKVDASTFALLAAQDNALEKVALAAGGPLSTGGGSETEFAVMEEGAALPYLPDPLLAEFTARIFDHPNISDKDLITIPVYAGSSEWPHAEPFKIHVYEADGIAQAKFDEASRTLLVPLPKAVRARLRLSVRLTPEALRLLGIWQWLSSADQAKLEEKALAGQHWMLTPWRTVELVHAVQRPLIQPDIYKLDIDKWLHKTYVMVQFITPLSIKSTDHIDLQARWNDPLDDMEQEAGANIERSDHAFSVKITDDKSYATWLSDPGFTGTPEHQIIGEDKIRVGKLFDKSPPKIHEFNDTRYRRIEYRVEATTRFREYMPAALLTDPNDADKTTDKHIKISSERVVDWIENSSPPPAPDVLYVIPTFGWTRDEGKSGKSSWRRGGGLRVYLDRPWCVTGYGEMLAVVLPNAKFSGDPNDAPADQPVKKFVTQWGNDPVWKSTYVQGVAPTRADFPLARTEADPNGQWLPSFAPAEEAEQPGKPFDVTDLVHPELTTSSLKARVDIAPHDVFYDAGRQLWYCDIEVNFNNAYYPFIRLALARYQPVSVGGAHLSNIVQADFMSLAPDRWLNLSYTKQPNVHRVKVLGSTYSNSSGAEEGKHAPMKNVKLPTGQTYLLKAADVSPRSVVEVWVEHLDPALGEDFGWQRDEEAIVKKDTKGFRFKASRKDNSAQALARMYTSSLISARSFSQILKENLVAQVIGPPTLWQGTVTLPETASSDTSYRLVVAEYEEYFVDDQYPYDAIPSAKGRRLVFVEHINLG